MQIIPKVKSFGEEFAESFGGGLSKGIQSATDFSNEIAKERYKRIENQKLVDSIENGNQQTGEKLAGRPQENGPSFQDQITAARPQIEKQLGFPLTDDQWKIASEQMEQEMGPQNQPQKQDKYRKAKQYAAVGMGPSSKVALAEVEGEREERHFQQKQDREEREYQDKAAAPFLEKQRANLTELPASEQSTKDLYRIAKSGKSEGIGVWAKNAFGLDFAKGEEENALNAALKAAFFEMASEFPTARITNYLEQQIRAMQYQPGQKKVSLFRNAALRRFQQDVKRTRAELGTQINREYRKINGSDMGNIEDVTSEAMGDYVTQRAQELEYELQRLNDEHSSEFDLASTQPVMPGTPLTQKRLDALVDANGGNVEKAIKAAEEAGYVPIDGEIAKYADNYLGEFR